MIDGAAHHVLINQCSFDSEINPWIGQTIKEQNIELYHYFPHFYFNLAQAPIINVFIDEKTHY